MCVTTLSFLLKSRPQKHPSPTFLPHPQPPHPPFRPPSQNCLACSFIYCLVSHPSNKSGIFYCFFYLCWNVVHTLLLCPYCSMFYLDVNQLQTSSFSTQFFSLDNPLCVGRSFGFAKVRVSSIFTDYWRVEILYHIIVT